MGKIMPSGVVREHTAIRPVASLVAVSSAASSVLPPPGSVPPPAQGRQGPGYRALASGTGSAGGGHEDHVDVAGVVQLAGAALAHGEHGDPARRGAGGQFRARDRERGAQHGRGDVRELARHLLGRGHAGHVARGEVQDVTLVRDAQHGRRVRPVQDREVSDGVLVERVRAHRVQQRRAQFGRRGPRTASAPRSRQQSSGCRAR